MAGVTVNRIEEEPAIWRRHLARVLVPLYLTLIFGACALCWMLAVEAVLIGQPLLGIALMLAGPLAYALAAGFLSRLHRRHVIEGRMPVDTGLRSYFHRRLYGLCWTSIYYSGPLYFVILSVPLLKRTVFRLFGYRGSMDFTIYPDTWIRDLPLLNFGRGTYLSNKATVGSNMIFVHNGKQSIVVGRIDIGAGSMIGHAALVGPGTWIGENVVMGVGSAIGRKASIGDRTMIGDVMVVDHGGTVGRDCVLGTRSYVGLKAHVPDGVHVPTLGTATRKAVSSERRGSY